MRIQFRFPQTMLGSTAPIHTGGGPGVGVEYLPLTWTPSIKNFVPAHLVEASHEMILRDLRTEILRIEKKLIKRGILGFFIDLEAHLKGDGQYGSFSGPDGMGVTLQSQCRVIDHVGSTITCETSTTFEWPQGFETISKFVCVLSTGRAAEIAGMRDNAVKAFPV